MGNSIAKTASNSCIRAKENVPTRKEFGQMCKRYLDAHGANALSELLATLLLNSEYRAENGSSNFVLDVGAVQVQCTPMQNSNVH